VILTPEEVRSAIEEPVAAMVDSVLSCLAQAPPELAQDLIVQGIHLVGGGGMLNGMDKRLSEESDVQVRLVEAPLEAVVLGAGKVIEHYESVQAMFMDGGTRR
jgi:rod shape-determining protein MreB